MIDTHCHIDDPQYASELDSFIALQKADGVEAMLVPGVNVESLTTVREVCKAYPNYLFPALGLHPEDVKDDWKEQLLIIRQALDDGLTQWIAIGEIGLDYHFSTDYKAEQQEAFREQLAWAVEKNLPVMIHVRDAAEDSLSILREYTQKGLRGVMHCFSGSKEVAQQYVGMGLKLGIGGVITFKNCHLADNLVGIPLSCLVLETDAPYMAPVPHRGERNESRWMHFVAERLAMVYGVSREEVEQQTTLNARDLFRLPL